MPRLNRKGELWSHLSSVAILRETTGTHGDSTLSSAVAAGATTGGVVSGTNFATNDLVKIGNGEVSEFVTLSNVVTNTLTWANQALMYAHNAGEEVFECTATDLGHVSDGGVTIEYSGSPDPVKSATQRLMLGYLSGHMSIMASFGVTGLNLENFCAALGMLESRIIGAGSSSNPYTLTIDGSYFKEENDIGLRFTGVRKDGGTVVVELWGVELDHNAINITFTRGQPAIVPFTARVTSGVLYQQY